MSFVVENGHVFFYGSDALSGLRSSGLVHYFFNLLKMKVKDRDLLLTPSPGRSVSSFGYEIQLVEWFVIAAAVAAVVDVIIRFFQMPPIRASPAIGWVFTLNNFTDDDIDHLKALFADGHVRYICFGKEVGENGTPHLQGYLELTKKQRLSGVKSLVGDRYHFEVRRGTSEQAIEYCKKDGDFFSLGASVGKGKRSDLDAVVESVKAGETVKAIATEHSVAFIKYHRGIQALVLATQRAYEHVEVRGVWFYGPPGVGKSFMARQLCPNAYLKPQSKWFDGYAGEKAIILDDLDKGGICLGHHLKIWADRYSCTGETKGGTVYLNHRVFIVTSNWSIEELFEETDENMIAAITRRFRQFAFSNNLHPPTGPVGTGQWGVDVQPPLPALLYESDSESEEEKNDDESDVEVTVQTGASPPVAREFVDEGSDSEEEAEFNI